MPVIMDALPIAPVSAGVALVILTWRVARWWYQRQVAMWAGRFRKCEHKLDETLQHAAMTRRQIEKLQRDLSDARRAHAVASSQLGSQRARIVARATPVPPASKLTPGNGLADTMPS